MVDVPIYVAIITAAAGIIGAAIPQITSLMRDVRQSERDRLERHSAATRQACLDMLRAASELRTQIANNHEYEGAEMGDRLALVRKWAAETQLHAVSVGLQVPAVLADPAARIAEAACRLAAVTAQNTNLAQGVMPLDPDFGELDERVAAFRQIAIADTGG